MRTLFAPITVYGQPNCSFCEKAKNRLTNAGIRFDYVDITQDEQAKIYVTEVIGARQVPVIVDDWHEPVIGAATLDGLIAFHSTSETGL